MGSLIPCPTVQSYWLTLLDLLGQRLCAFVHAIQRIHLVAHGVRVLTTAQIAAGLAHRTGGVSIAGRGGGAADFLRRVW